LAERSRLPRHKVCGEFLSPEIERELELLGVWREFQGASPARIRRLGLHFGSRSKFARLQEHAWGLSRYAFDDLLWRRAFALGAERAVAPADSAQVLASGRDAPQAPRGGRLFGFKTHFEGPQDDAVELFFFNGIYVGVSSIEGGRTNVCGLGPEDYLGRFAFDYDRVIQECAPLRSRLAPLTRVMEWLSTGPLEYRQRFFDALPGVYRAGDALSFVDPFTGSGLLVAVRTGAMAGRAAARRFEAEAYLEQARRSLRKPFAVSAILREVVASGWAERLVGIAPSRLLFALTRPR
jgi:hypothetical protein